MLKEKSFVFHSDKTNWTNPLLDIENVIKRNTQKSTQRYSCKTCEDCGDCRDCWDCWDRRETVDNNTLETEESVFIVIKHNFGAPFEINFYICQCLPLNQCHICSLIICFSQVLFLHFWSLINDQVMKYWAVISGYKKDEWAVVSNLGHTWEHPMTESIHYWKFLSKSLLQCISQKNRDLPQ